MRFNSWVSRMTSIGLTTLLLSLAVATAEAQDAQAWSNPQLGGSAGTSGLGFFLPNSWGVMQTHVLNRTDTDRDMRIIFSFTEQPSRQYVRHVTIPAMSRRAVQIPARFEGVPDENRTAKTETILVAPDVDREWDREPGIVRMYEGMEITAMLAENDASDDEAIEAVSSLRERLGLGRSMGYVNDERLMRFDLSWEALNTLAITTDRPTIDAVQRRALRRWLSGGGTLIVFLDQVDSDAMRMLLGDAWTVEPVDTVTLNRVSFNKVDPTLSLGPGDEAFSAVAESEQPITMRRVLADGFRTHLAVRGWPALMSRSYGRGRVVVTTVGGRAYTTEGAESATDVFARVAMPAATQAQSQTMPPAAALRTPAGTAFLANQVGYTVVSRATIAAVLGGFAGLFIVCGVWLHLKGRLEMIGPIGAGFSIVAAVVLVMIGLQQRGQIEPAATTVQLIEAEPESPTAVVRGVMGLFTPESGQIHLSSDAGGWAWPSGSDDVGALMRMTWRDVDTWTWTNLPLPPAVLRPVDFEATVRFERPVIMDLRYGPEGLSGVVDWPDGYEPRDTLIATTHANLAVNAERRDDGLSVRVRPGDVLPSGSYFSEGIMTDERKNHAIVYDRMFRAPSGSKSGDEFRGAAPEPSVRFNEPMLLTWTGLAPLEITTDPSLRPVGRAVWTVPLRIKPTEPGTAVRIPWPLIPMEPARLSQAERERHGLAMLPIYNQAREAFFPVSGSSAFVGRFTVPQQVQPLDPADAVLHFDITASGRPVEVFTIKDGTKRVVTQLDSPDGPVSITIPADTIGVDEHGAIHVGFEVGHPANFTPGDVQASSLWEVRRFGLEAAGTVRASDQPVASNIRNTR